MLGGEYQHNIDQKNRIFIPAKMREELGETFVVAKNIREKSLIVYSLAGWEEYIAPIKKLDRQLAEPVLRYLHSNLAQVTPDAQGRVVLSPELVAHAEIERSAVVVGCGSYAEIWSEELYKQMEDQVNVAEMRAKLESLGL